MKENKKPNSFERASKILKNTDVKYVLVVVENVENGGIGMLSGGRFPATTTEMTALAAGVVNLMTKNIAFRGLVNACWEHRGGLPAEKIREAENLIDPRENIGNKTKK